jgi:N utilization substance protein B
MTKRSRAREVALQLLFQRDHNPSVSSETTEHFIETRLRDDSTRPFCRQLYEGVIGKLDEIDSQLAVAAENWRLPRMATVDRNVLRLGAYELLCTPQTPPTVVLDEAIELARRYGSAESPAFVNGVLDKLRQNLAGVEAPVDTPQTDSTAGCDTNLPSL